MRRISQILSLLLAVLMTIGLFTGCKKEVTSADLMKKYSDNYSKPIKEPAIIWMYGAEDIKYFGKWMYHNTLLDKENGNQNEKIKCITYRELSKEQLGIKIQTEILGGSGPDLIHTVDPNLFVNLNKTSVSGAFQDWNSLIKDWSMDGIFVEALDAMRTVDGDVYILPLSFNPTFIVTTKANMEQYGFTEADFSDFNKTTDTLYQIYQKTKNEDKYVHVYYPKFAQVMPNIFDEKTKQTSLTAPESINILQKWNIMLSELNDRMSSGILINDQSMLKNGDRVLEFIDLYSLMFKIQAGTLKLDSEHVYIPLRDTEGKITGNITAYALVSQKCKNTEAVSSYLKRKVYLIGANNVIADGIHNVFTGIHLGKDSTKDWFDVNLNSKSDDFYNLVEESLDGNEMNLIVWNEAMEKYNTTITEYLQHPETADWEELERSINIYLSE